MPKSNIKSIPIQNKSVIVHVCLFYSLFVCMSAYANVYFKTTIIKQNITIILLQKRDNVVYWKTKRKIKNELQSKQHSYVRGPLRECRSIWSGTSGLPYYCAPLVCVSDVIDSLAVWWYNKPKTKSLSSTANTT